MRFVFNKSNISSSAVSSRVTQSLFIIVLRCPVLLSVRSVCCDAIATISARAVRHAVFVAEAGIEPALTYALSPCAKLVRGSQDLFPLPVCTMYSGFLCFLVPRRFPKCPLTFLVPALFPFRVFEESGCSAELIIMPPCLAVFRKVYPCCSFGSTPAMSKA